MQRRAKYWTWYGLAWIPMAFIYAVVVMQMQHASFGRGLVEGLSYVYVPAILGIGVWWLTGKLPWPPRHLWHLVVVHLVCAALFAATWEVTEFLLIAWGTGFYAARVIVNQFIGYEAFDSLFFYAAIAAGSHVIRIGVRLREQEARAARAESLRVQAELAALRGQLNPHFLFNTLHTLVALVRRDPPTAEHALEQFGDMLRYVLDVKRSRREDGPLADELKFLRSYLSLEQLRLGDRLRVVEQIDPDALDCVLPSLTLQPLVENAIKYGIAPRASGGTMTLTATLVDDALELEVADDGPGAPPTVLADERKDGSGVGLRAVRQRLDARYGRSAAFVVVTAPNEGFRVRIRLPATSVSGTPAGTVA
ncbi:MAG TPA: histidine kinase [Gemmatimonadaceae bacterium]|nr:histidine kinase [Gemmatimonadaceae bacterium]